MLQQVVIKRIERIFRLRLFYGLHLALFSLVLALCALSSADPLHLQNAALALMTWLPVLLLHTVVQAYYEVRARCAPFEPVPAPSFSRAMLPVDVYDEDGNLVSASENRIDFLLPPRTERQSR